MAFTFQYEVNLEDGASPMVVHEPNNELVVYYEYIGAVLNRIALPVLGTYDDLVLTEQPARLTMAKISSYGVKSSVGIGSFGFFVDEKAEHTYIRIPIRDISGLASPTFSVDQTDKTITYSIMQPELILYESFRMVFRQGLLAYEFITYDILGEVEKPFGMQGDFVVTCVGYRNEIQDISQPAGPLNINITRRSDDSDTETNNTMVTLLAAGWEDDSQTVDAQGVSLTNIAIVAPIPASQDAYTFYGILCVEQGDGTLRFTCTTEPLVDINVGVVIL